MNIQVRPSALSGSFMQADASALARDIQHYLQAAPRAQGALPKLLIVPHAGHIYSGSTAARAYASLLYPGEARSTRVRRVVLLGPAHRVYFQGIALPAAQAFATPLGLVPVDGLGAQALADLPFVSVRADVHGPEHSLEVQLPFLQQMLGPFELLPLVVGDAPVEQVLQVLERLWGGPEVLILISTDLSHFHPYAQAQALDAASCAQIGALDGTLNHDQACGATPLNAALRLARQRGLEIRELGRCNSGDTGANSPEGRARVVGYASFAVFEPAPAPLAGQLTPEQGARLLRLARASLHAATGAAPVEPVVTEDLQVEAAAFVTLTQQGQLRGCIGSLQAHRPLASDVQANAIAAATQDPRFAAVSAAEAPGLRVEVSVLTAPQPLPYANQAHALWQLRPGVDGVILSYAQDGRQWRSTFLPQVWEQLPQPIAFLAQLKAKAGLPPDFWNDTIRLARYQVQKFLE